MKRNREWDMQAQEMPVTEFEVDGILPITFAYVEIKFWVALIHLI